MTKKALATALLLTLGSSGYALAAETTAETVAEDASVAVAEKAAVPEYNLDEMVVTAERMPARRMETPANVATVTAAEIESNSYTSVAEAIENIPGVMITRQGGGAREFVRLNGDDRVLILVDGQRLNDEQGAPIGKSSADLGMLPSTHMIERIEVVKGGASALYGSDAVGGVINIITKDAKALRTTLDLSTGSWGTHQYEIMNEGKAGNFSWMVSGAIDRAGNFDYKYGGSKHTMEGSDKHNNRFAIKLKEKLSKNSAIGLFYSHRSVDQGVWNCTGAASTSADRLKENFNNISLTYDFKTDTKAPGRVRYYNNYKSVFQQTRMESRVQGVDYQDGWVVNKNNTIIAGLEWRQSDSSNRDGGNYEGKKLSNTALFVQDKISIGKKWSVVPGLRMDKHSEFGTHWTPKLAANYLADKDTNVYASWGRVFKAPTADDMFYNVDYGPGWGGMYGNPDLKPETGWTATVGMNHNFSKDATIGVSFFETHLSDSIRWQNVGLDWIATNIDREKRRGVELTYKHRLNSNWSFDLGYAYTMMEVDKGNGYHTDFYNKEPNSYRFGLHYANRGWKANLEAQIVGGLIAQDGGADVYRSSRYGILNLSTSYDFTKDLSVYARLNNLTNAAYDTCYSSYGSYYPAAGRSFMLGMRVSF